ncbi:MAG: SlyX family protein [Marinobacterium sp.]|nr:SlyX family protein [Marinobacterium sp.]
MSDEQRLADLESRVAFQEDAIDKLSDVIARQDRELIQLKELVITLHKQVKQLDLSAPTAPGDEPPPPHY